MPVRCREWQLPARGRHRAEKGDIFVGGIWSSVGKWFVAGRDCNNRIVTNGMHRLRMKKDKEKLLFDLVAGLNTEAYRIQGRAYTTGSDGLADLPEDALTTIILPKVSDTAARKALQLYIDALLEGRSTMEKAVTDLIAEGKLAKIDVPVRKHHVVLV